MGPFRIGWGRVSERTLLLLPSDGKVLLRLGEAGVNIFIHTLTQINTSHIEKTEDHSYTNKEFSCRRSGVRAELSPERSQVIADNGCTTPKIYDMS